MINNLTIVGRVMKDPTSNPAKTAATLLLSVQRNYKPEGEQYYPTDVFACKALSEARAKLVLDKFIKGDIAVVQGRLQKSNDYKNQAGEDVKGEFELIIDHIDGPYVFRGNAENNGGAQGGAKITTPPAPKAPAAVPPAAPRTAPPAPPAAPRTTPPVPPRP